MPEMKQFYQDNITFKDYVDKICEAYNKSLEDVLALAITQQYYHYLKEN